MLPFRRCEFQARSDGSGRHWGDFPGWSIADWRVFGHVSPSPANVEADRVVTARNQSETARAVILARMAEGLTLTHALLGNRLWSLLEDPFTVFDDVSPRLLLEGGLIALAQRGSVKAARADVYRLTEAGLARAKTLKKEVNPV